VADFYAAFVQEILNVSQRQREPDVEHNRQANDLRACFEVAEEGRFCHPGRLKGRPCRLKPSSSDNTRIRGAVPFSRGQLHYLLTNPVYIGRIRHKKQSYPGLHTPIITADLWDRVQAKLMAASARPRGRSVCPTESRILTGKLRDEAGDLLTPTHTQRHGRRFAYYVSHRLIAGGTDPSGWRLPAEALEASLKRLLAAHLRKAAGGQSMLSVPDATAAAEIARRVEALANRVEADAVLFGSLITAVSLQQGRIKLLLAEDPIAQALSVPTEALAPDLLAFDQNFTLRRRGVETRILAGTMLPAPDPVLIRTLAEAHVWATSLRAGTSLTEIAAATGHSEPYIRTRIPLAFLAPKVQAAILDGRQPADISLARLLRDDIPMDWSEQERLFAIA
jgi:site-specific DNA recombinase